MYYDIHCHLFNKDFLAKELLYRLFVELRKITFNNKRSSFTDLLLEKLRTLKRVNNFLKTGFRSDSTEIYNELISRYKEEVIITPLMFDLTWCFASSKDRSFVEGTNDIIDLINQELSLNFQTYKDRNLDSDHEIEEKINRELQALEQSLKIWGEIEENKTRSFQFPKFEFPDSFDGFNEQINQLASLKYTPGNENKVFPFLAVDPRRSGILEYAKEHVGPGKLFCGIKLYTPNGYSPTDPLLFDENNGLYSFCENHNVPITVHNSFGGFATLANKVKINGHVWINNQAVTLCDSFLEFEHSIFQGSKAIEERADKLNNPSLWKLVVERFPNLQINLAHFGGGTELFNALSNPLNDDLWSNKIMKLIINPNYRVYTDLSCMGVNDIPVIKKLIKHKDYNIIKNRILFGSDFYLCKLFDDDLAITFRKFKSSFKEDFYIIASKNPKTFLGNNALIESDELIEPSKLIVKE